GKKKCMNSSKTGCKISIIYMDKLCLNIYQQEDSDDKLHPTHTEYPLYPERQIVKYQKLGPYQNNNLIDKLSESKFAETEKLVATLETKTDILSTTETFSNVSN
ncbi:20313_t:CDS:2, partial [Funneliformis geosporum]